MEKQSVGVLMVLFLCTFSLQSQDSLLVFKTSGTVLSSQPEGRVFPVTKGHFVNQMQVIVLEEDSELTSLDHKGNAYRITNPGRFTFSELLQYLQKDLNTGVTASYFKYLWEEFRQQNNEAIIGGVFRGDRLMQFPPDSALVASEKIRFRWIAPEAASVFLFLWDATGTLRLKTGLEGTSLDMYTEPQWLEDMDVITWAVTTEPYPNFDNLPRFSLRLTDRNTYMEERGKYTVLISDLKSLGLGETEIDNILCEDYGLCK